jgi:Zn-dependent protease with chaperone function
MTNKIYFNEALYKQEAGKVAASIFGFIFLYLLLFTLTVGIAIFAFIMGGGLIAAYPHFITLAIGGSLMLFGIFIVYFMVKFLFVKSDNTDPYRVKITEAEHPELFKLINDIATQAGSDKPAGVYLSHRVNACVFYNSYSFWSLLFPVRKNLELGLGLFNALSISELSTIIAHEFGHFSQKSMKFGPYVYHANRVIYNMLYENQSWEQSVENIGEKHWAFKIFTGLSLGYANLIKSIMQKVYGFINVRYMSLSRQMEFHADSVSVEICGTVPFRMAMMKMEWIDTAMNETLDTLNGFSKNNLKAGNLFELQDRTLQILAKYNKVVYSNHTIDITTTEANKNYYRQKVKVADQWASHPATSERLENAAALNIERAVNTRPSWQLFTNADFVQKSITEHLYRESQINNATDINADEYEERYNENINRYKFPEVYKSYYSNRIIQRFDLDNLLPENTNRNPFNELFTEDTVSPSAQLRGLISDIELLKQIESETIKLKFFDFNGEKQEAHLAYVCRKKLEEELDSLRASLLKTDKWVYDYVCYNYPDTARLLKEKYEQVLLLDARTDEFNKIFHDAFTIINSVYYNKELTFVKSQTDHFKNNQLQSVLGFFKTLAAPDGLLQKYPDKEFEKILSDFMSNNYTYFLISTLYTDQFNHLINVCHSTANYLNYCTYIEFKSTCELQAETVLQPAQVSG